MLLGGVIVAMIVEAEVGGLVGGLSGVCLWFPRVVFLFPVVGL